MQYSDKEILDLESSLEGVGHESISNFGLLKAVGTRGYEGFPTQILKDFKRRFADEKIEFFFSNILAQDKMHKCFRIKGPSIRTRKLVDEIAEKYNIETIFIFD
jgi:hypothetical protein